MEDIFSDIDVFDRTGLPEVEQIPRMSSQELKRAMSSFNDVLRRITDESLTALAEQHEVRIVEGAAHPRTEQENAPAPQTRYTRQQRRNPSLALLAFDARGRAVSTISAQMLQDIEADRASARKERRQRQEQAARRMAQHMTRIRERCGLLPGDELSADTAVQLGRRSRRDIDGTADTAARPAKRPRGRPRKHPKPLAATGASATQGSRSMSRSGTRKNTRDEPSPRARSALQ
ncbi:MAG: hypothetical protein MHM6MM_008057 [Cercozoa sp. M6MM]